MRRNPMQELMDGEVDDLEAALPVHSDLAASDASMKVVNPIHEVTSPGDSGCYVNSLLQPDVEARARPSPHVCSNVV